MKAIPGPARIDLITWENGAWNDRIGSMVVNKASDAPVKITGSWAKVLSSNDVINV